jgi:GABA permease
METTAGPKRILVIANETVADPVLKATILERARGGNATILVVCPALNSRLKHWFSDDDHARAHAAERLDSSLLALWAEGLDVNGKVGDSDPMVALADALATFAPHEVIVSTHPPGRSNWLEKNVIERARTLCCPIHVLHVVANGTAVSMTEPAIGSRGSGTLSAYTLSDPR